MPLQPRPAPTKWKLQVQGVICTVAWMVAWKAIVYPMWLNSSSHGLNMRSLLRSLGGLAAHQAGIKALQLFTEVVFGYAYDGTQVENQPPCSTKCICT